MSLSPPSYETVGGRYPYLRPPPPTVPLPQDIIPLGWVLVTPRDVVPYRRFGSVTGLGYVSHWIVPSLPVFVVKIFRRLLWNTWPGSPSDPPLPSLPRVRSVSGTLSLWAMRSQPFFTLNTCRVSEPQPCLPVDDTRVLPSPPEEGSVRVGILYPWGSVFNHEGTTPVWTPIVMNLS